MLQIRKEFKVIDIFKNKEITISQIYLLMVVEIGY